MAVEEVVVVHMVEDPQEVMEEVVVAVAMVEVVVEAMEEAEEEVGVALEAKLTACPTWALDSAV
jgi:hypothetical protein